MILVNQKCGSCNKSFTGGYVSNYSGIGKPFVQCPSCGGVNDNSGNVTEWKLKSSPGKIFFVFQHVISVLLLYGVGGLIFPILLSAIFLDSGTAERFLIDNLGFLGIAVFSVLFGLIRFFIRLARAIKASNARMNNDSYVAELQLMGFAKQIP